MTKVVILGHGGYGSSVQRNLGMLIGEQEQYAYIDFNETDDLSILQEKLKNVLEQIGEHDVLFCCDLAGGSPFREAAQLCLEHPERFCIAGLNTAAYAEMSFNLELSPKELAELAADTAKQSIMLFPQ